ncbi:MAG: LamG-like jellyroll fold domain-containing protein, partial [Luteolibacter sp.]
MNRNSFSWPRITPFRFEAATAYFAAWVLLSILPASAGLINRWSFNNANGSAAAGTAVTDSVGGQNAFIRGQGANFANGVLTLPGSTTGNEPPSIVSSYIDLPNGIVSSKTNLTVEIWATPLSHQSYQRLIDFGRVNVAGDGLGAAGEITGSGTYDPNATQASDGLTLTLSRASLNEQRFEGKLNGAANNNDPAALYRMVDTSLATVAGTTYHYVMTFEDGAGSLGAAGGRLSWYRDGVLIAASDVGFHLNQIEDVNNWLGRSLWSNDRGSNASYDEVRIYDQSLSLAAINASRTLGPNPALPVAQADAITMHRGQKASIPVLANDTRGILAKVMTAPQFGIASVDSQGRILYSHTSGTPATDTFTYCAVNAAGESSSATVTITFSDSLRVTNPSLNVPSTPPPTVYEIVDAFGALAFTDPVCLTTPPGETQRLFVCQKGGLLRMIPNVLAGAPTASTFLDLAGLLTSRSESISTNGEQGLLSVAFHPQYATNGYFFIFYSVNKGGTIYERLSRFKVQTGNPNA